MENSFTSIIASGPVIIENNKVLLNRHGDTEEKRKLWKFVGGRVEVDDYKPGTEVLEDACRREVKEEMGLEVEIITPLKPMLIIRPEKPGEYVILIHYLAKRMSEIKAGKDIVEWNWFDINNLPESCAPNIAPVINEYKKLKKYCETI